MLGAGEGVTLAGEFHAWGDDVCLNPSDSVWFNTSSDDYAPYRRLNESNPESLFEYVPDGPLKEGFAFTFLELETRNMLGNFATELGYTRYSPAFNTTVYITAIDHPSGCDGYVMTDNKPS